MNWQAECLPVGESSIHGSFEISPYVSSRQKIDRRATGGYEQIALRILNLCAGDSGTKVQLFRVADRRYLRSSICRREVT
jgi:hypothetical protein